MFFVGGFLRYNKLSHQIFIKKHSPKTNGWNPKNWWFESMFFPFVKGGFSRFIALGLLGPVLRVSRFQHTYSQHRGFWTSQIQVLSEILAGMKPIQTRQAEAEGLSLAIKKKHLFKTLFVSCCFQTNHESFCVTCVTDWWRDWKVFNVWFLISRTRNLTVVHGWWMVDHLRTWE